jgi:hypothetical protein
MTAKRKPATKAKRVTRRMSRQSLARELVEITKRLEKQYWLADAIVAVNRPNDEAPMIEHRLRTVLGLQLEVLFRGLGDVRDFAKMVSDAATRESAPPDIIAKARGGPRLPRAHRCKAATL